MVVIDQFYHILPDIKLAFLIPNSGFQQGKSLNQYAQDAFPTRFIPDNIKRYLYAQSKQKCKNLLRDRYEFLVYRLLHNGLEAGDIFCRNSVRFRSSEDDLVGDQQWQEKERLIANAGLSILQKPIQKHLTALEEQLEKRLTEVNQRILSGEFAILHCFGYQFAPRYRNIYDKVSQSLSITHPTPI